MVNMQTTILYTLETPVPRYIDAVCLNKCIYIYIRYI